MRSAEFLIDTNVHKTEILFTRLFYWHVKYQVTRSTLDIAFTKGCENKFLIILKLGTPYGAPQIKLKQDTQCTYWGAIVQPFLQRKSDKNYVF
jgi:hypothetical protein